MILVPAYDEIIPLVESCSSADRNPSAPEDGPRGGHLLPLGEGPDDPRDPLHPNISATPTQPGDTCSVATPVVLSNGPAGGTATLTGTTVGMTDDFYACYQTFPAFPDHVYSVTFDRELDLSVKMTPQQTSSKGVLTMLSDMCGTFGSVLCGYPADTNGVTVMRAGSLQPGTHYFSVDHSSGGPGAYSLEISALPHQPGETCSGPLPITFSGGSLGRHRDRHLCPG